METAEARKVHDTLLASKPEGARHDADICPFCVADRAEQRSGALPSTDGPDVSEHNTDPDTKGGTTDMSDSISKETHDALLAKAVADATADLSKQLETVTAERDDLAAKHTAAETKVTELTAETARLNGELDTAQVARKAAEDEVASLKTSIEEAEAKAVKTELANKRADQVKTLELFTPEYIGEKAEAWAELTDEAWGERLAEWQQLRPAKESTDEADATKKTTETASALSGTTGDLTKTPPVETASEKPPARRRVLGLS